MHMHTHARVPVSFGGESDTRVHTHRHAHERHTGQEECRDNRYRHLRRSPQRVPVVIVVVVIVTAAAAERLVRVGLLEVHVVLVGYLFIVELGAAEFALLAVVAELAVRLVVAGAALLVAVGLAVERFRARAVRFVLSQFRHFFGLLNAGGRGRVRDRYVHGDSTHQTDRHVLVLLDRCTAVLGTLPVLL